jgi:hypothetical protein
MIDRPIALAAGGLVVAGKCGSDRGGIEIVDSFAKIAGGNGGYREDRGYDWYAGS